MPQGILEYDLYGDLLAGNAPDPIHLEPIKERSSQHDWTIRVHKHRRLAQVFLFRSAGVRFTLGEIEHLTFHPTILVAHPDIPHGFRFAEDVIGDVLSVRIENVPDVLRERFVTFNNPTNAVFTKPETACFDAVAALFDQLGHACRRLDEQRFSITAALVDLIMLYLVAEKPSHPSLVVTAPKNRRGRQDVQVEAFCAMVEESFRNPWPVSAYASRIGLSTSHLTRICRAALGAPPNAIVRQRRILEAKRLLEYTGLSLSEIAHRSGFRDTAFFSRTFKSLAGVSPNAYRSKVN